MAKATDPVSESGYSSTVRKVLAVDSSGNPITSSNPLPVDASVTIDKDVNLNVENTSVNTSGMTGKPSNGDFVTAYNSSDSILCSSLPSSVSNLTSADIVSITQITTSGSRTIYFADDNTITVSGNIITVDGASFSSTDTFVVQTNINDENSYDSSTNTDQTTVLNPVWERYTDAETLVEAQDLTSSYADFGNEIDLNGYTKLGVWIVADVNDSENVDLKLLGKTEFGGTDEFDLNSGGSESLWTTGASDFKKYYEFDVSAIPIVQLQAKAGTVGGTAGNLTIYITKLWK